jgi:PAS domain S-box-containing protein
MTRPDGPHSDSRNLEQARPLRVLLVEDSEDDAALVMRELCRGGYDLVCERVDTPAAMNAALAWQPWDIVIADYAMPRFSGLAALRLLQQAAIDLPFLLVSGTIGEDVAVAAMKAGAHDYIMKDNLTRLVPAVQRGLREAQMRRDRRRAEETLQLRDRAIEALSQGVLITDAAQPDNPAIYVNPGFTCITGYAPEDVIGRNCRFLHGPQTDQQTLGLIRSAINDGTPCNFELVNYRKDGTPFWNALSISPVCDASGTITHFVGVQTDITERKRLEATLRAEAEIWSALARVGRELIASLDTPVLLQRLCQLTAEVLHCDASHTLLRQPDDDAYVLVSSFGNTPEQWEALRVMEFPVALAAGFLSHLAEQEVVQVPVAPSKDAGPLTLAARFGAKVMLCVALRYGSEIIGVLTASHRTSDRPFSPQEERIARGIGQLASMALENARLVEKVESASRIRADFIATMSHELRTPLNVIIGYHELLLEGDFGILTPEQLDPLERADRSARELLQLINSTLDLSRLEAGQLPVALRDVSLRDVIDEIIAEARVAWRRPGVDLVWDVAPTLPRLHTDPVKLKVVLKNLVANALKFTERGSVTVVARSCEGGVEISVTDTGIGIAPEALPIIFEPFRQVDSSNTRPYGGVGLGLYVVRRLLDLLGATISIESELGRGSTFRVRIPAVPSPARLQPGGGPQ